MTDSISHHEPPELGRIDKLLATVRLVAFDFDGVFTDNTVYVTQAGDEAVCCWRSDGIGLQRLRGAGVHFLIVSAETNPIVAIRAAKLQSPFRQGVDNKAAAILEFCLEHGVDPRHAMFVGNDVNDIPAFKAVGVPVAVRDAYPEVLRYVAYQTAKPGGHGAVREICDLIIGARMHSRGAADPHET